MIASGAGPAPGLRPLRRWRSRPNRPGVGGRADDRLRLGLDAGAV